MRFANLLLILGCAVALAGASTQTSADASDKNAGNKGANFNPGSNAKRASEASVGDTDPDSDSGYDSWDDDASQSRHWAKPQPSDPAPDSLLLLLKPGVKSVSCAPLRGLQFSKMSSDGRPSAILGIKASYVRAYRDRRRRLAELDPNTDISDAGLANEIVAECPDEVAAATPDAPMYSNSRPIAHTLVSDRKSGLGRRLRQTSDTYIKQQWGLAAIRAPAAWTLGAAGSASIPTCVVDTGAQLTHPDLLKNLLRNPGEVRVDGKDDDGNGYIDDILGARDLTIGQVTKTDGSFGDDNGHGTHVSGIIGAIANNSAGVAGVAPRTKLIECKALDATGSGLLSNLIKCLDYCTARGARIINNSWGSNNGEPYWNDFMENFFLSNPDVLYVFAAGNDNVDLDQSPSYGFPGVEDAPNVITVGAISTAFSRAGFSNYGTAMVDVGAPGVNIYSTYIGSSYAILQGTSMAAAYVTGAAAAILGRRPSLSPIQLRQSLMQTCTKVSSDSAWNGCGGYINMEAAVRYAIALP